MLNVFTEYYELKCKHEKLGMIPGVQEPRMKWNGITRLLIGSFSLEGIKGIWHFEKAKESSIWARGNGFNLSCPEVLRYDRKYVD